MFQLKGDKGKKTKQILAIVIIVLILPMVLGTVIGSMYINI